MIRKLLATFVLLLGCSAVLAADLSELRDIYDSEMRKLDYQNRKELLRLPQDHIKRLSELEDSFRAAGDLQSLLTVRKERERFIGNPRVENIRVVSQPAQLAALQRRYIDEYKTVKSEKEAHQKDLSEKYLRALKAMQRELTRQNKIDEALKIMQEIERIEKGGGRVAATNDTGTSSTPAPAPAASVASVDLSTVRNALNGKVAKWNPRSHVLSVEYDFSANTQAVDWRGGTIDDIDAALVCDRQQAQFVLPFQSISQLSFEALFQGDAQRARVSLGRQLHVDVIGDDVGQALVWQGSQLDPVVRRVPSLRSAIANRCELGIEGKQASLSVNYEAASSGTLRVGLLAPLSVVLGLADGACSFQRVIITGVLAPEALTYLSQKSR